jgi:hypothetical protein
MPQPIHKKCEINFEGLTNLPEHAAMLGHIVSQASLVDSNLGYLLAYLTQTSASVAIAMFHAVNSTDAQRAMLNAAAEQQLAGAELDEFKDLLSDFRTRSGERNRLVHNIWGISPQHPGKAVWCPAKDYTKLPVTLAITQTADALPLFMEKYEGIWESCSVYTVKDLQDVYKRLTDFGEQVRSFMVKLLAEHPALAAIGQQPISSPDSESPKA